MARGHSLFPKQLKTVFLRWNATELARFVGEKMRIDIYDYRCCDFGWIALDSFVIPAAWIQIDSISPSGGPRAGGTTLTIKGKNFGSSSEGITVFIGLLECKNTAMTRGGDITCVSPPGTGEGLTVSVVVGDYVTNVNRGPLRNATAPGPHQASHAASDPF